MNIGVVEHMVLGRTSKAKFSCGLGIIFANIHRTSPITFLHKHDVLDQDDKMELYVMLLPDMCTMSREHALFVGCAKGGNGRT